MQSSPQTTQLSQKFKQLDNNHVGYIKCDQFKAYIDHQPRKLPPYMIGELFNQLPNSQMNQQQFICFVMGYRLNMEQLAISRFAMEKQLSKHVSASPASGVNQIRKSSAKFSVASKKNLSSGDKHKLNFSFGYDEKTQSKRYQQFADILDRKPEEVVGIIKFKVDGAHQQIRSGIQSIIDTAKGILSEMDEQLFRIIDLFKFTVKANGNYIYIFVQVGHVFFQDMARFLDQLIKSLNPETILRFSALLQSNYFKDFLKQGGEKKLQDVEFQMNLDVDDQTLNKLKQIAGNQNQFPNDKQRTIATLLLLLQQVNLDASFSNSQKLFNHLGVGGMLTGSKSQLGALKQMELLENVQAFVPNSKQVIQNIKKHGKGDGQISINVKNCYLKIEFNVSIEGIFDLL